MLPATAPLWAVAALTVPVGLGGPLVVPPLTAHLLDHVPADRAGHARFLHGLRTSLLVTTAVLPAATAATPLPGQRRPSREPAAYGTPR